MSHFVCQLLCQLLTAFHVLLIVNVSSMHNIHNGIIQVVAGCIILHIQRRRILGIFRALILGMLCYYGLKEVDRISTNNIFV